MCNWSTWICNLPTEHLQTIKMNHCKPLRYPSLHQTLQLENKQTKAALKKCWSWTFKWGSHLTQTTFNAIWLLVPDSTVAPSQKTDTLIGFSCTKVSSPPEEKHIVSCSAPFIVFIGTYYTHSTYLHFRHSAEALSWSDLQWVKMWKGRRVYDIWKRMTPSFYL